MKNDDAKHLPLLDPHFFSNTINAIEGLVNLQRNREASRYLIHFSRFSRRLMNVPQGAAVTLEEELKMMEHYLALERLRHRDQLSHVITCSPDLQAGRVRVPAYLFQSYLEKAIWYGIRPKVEPGRLLIHFSRQDHEWHCVIEDDGIGRAAARRQLAASILKPADAWPRLTAISWPEFGEIKTETLDLTDEAGRAMGTRVRIMLPIKPMNDE